MGCQPKADKLLILTSIIYRRDLDLVGADICEIIARSIGLGT